jgi:hypothetical protein
LKHTNTHTVAILIKPPGSTHTSPKEQGDEQQEKEFYGKAEEAAEDRIR